MRYNALLLWYVLGAIAAIAIAWLAAVIHASGHAPVGLISLGVGTLLGAALSAIATSGHRPQGGRFAVVRPLVIGAVILSILTVLAEHAWLYVDFRRQWHEATIKSPQAALFRPDVPSPGEYFAYELTPQNAVLWTIDAAIITAAAVGMVMLFRRDRN